MSSPSPDAIPDVANDAIFVLDFKGILSLWNKGAERLYGWKREEVLGRCVHDILQTHFPVALADTIATIQRGEEWRGELVHTTRGGDAICVDSRWSPQVDGEGNIIGAVEISRDITALKMAWQRSETSFHMLVEHSPHGTFLSDANGRYLQVNTAGAEMLGYAKSEMLALTLADVIAPEDASRIAGEVAYLGDGGVLRSDWQFRRKDGSQFPVEVVGRRLPDDRLQVIAADLTERKRAEEALLRKNDQLRSLLQISQKLTSKLDLQGIFAAASDCLRGVVLFDVAAVVLPEANGRISIRPLDSPTLGETGGDEEVVLAEPQLAEQVPGDGLVRVLRHEELRRLRPDFFRRLLAAGIRSACCTLLCTGDGPTGSLWLGSTRDPGFSDSDLGWVRQVSALLSIALDNSRAYQEIARLKNRLTEEKQNLEQEMHRELNLEEIIGDSPTLQHVLEQARLVADTDATVLLLGETGTGKELIARTIHRI